MLNKSRSRAKSAFRRPMSDVTNEGWDNRARFLKTEANQTVERKGSLDRLLVVRSDLSDLISQIDNLVAQAISKKKYQRKDTKRLNLSLPWFARLQEALTSTTTVTSKNQIKTHSTPFPVKTKLPSKTDTPQQNLTISHSTPFPVKTKLPSKTDTPRQNLTISQSLTNTSTMSLKSQIENHTTPYPYKRAQQSLLTSKTDSMQLDLLVSPSPLVPLRGDYCTAIDGGKQLFLLTPLQKSQFEVSKAAPPTKTLLPDTSTFKTHERHGKDGVPITESMSKVRFCSTSNTVLPTKPLPNIPVTSTSKNCEKDVKDRVPLAEPVREAGFYGLSKSVPDVSGGKMHEKHEKFGVPISKPVHDLKVINQKKEVSDTLDWFFSPPKTCVLMEPSDEQRRSNWKTLKESSTPVDKNKRYGDSCEKNWNNLYMSATCTKKGETTLKRELWTRFEAVSTGDLRLNTDIFQNEDGKGFLDLLDEASN
ncbi:hypothetical protein FCM35_KLT07055 [Carex littledalei]|uniref:Uncharacterized protein n=1 Tax=Carex littledalei TaxID=544730 RepID=A0A833QSI4_9POAL|nr:hypothetical protein FCM35_KLT07055 [Carex littledalei]